MTRWARGGNGNKKKVHDASSWEELQQEMQYQQKGGERSKKRHAEREQVHHNKKHKSIDKKIKNAGNNFSEKTGHFSDKKKNKKKHALLPNEGEERTDPFPSSKQSLLSKESSSNARTEFSSKKVTSPIPLPSGKSLIDALSEMDTSVKSISGESFEDGGAKVSLRGNEYLESLKKKEKRSEERRLKRQQRKMDDMVCFHCRQAGHAIADCPDIIGDIEQGTGICFRCGSTEHDVSKCFAKVDKKLGEFPYAKCFICNQTGHLSRTCPDNPRGLYPEGGGCKECGSVEHRWWNCPAKKPVKGVSADVTTVMSKGHSHMSVDAEPAFMSKPKVKVKKSGPKVVVF